MRTKLGALLALLPALGVVGCKDNSKDEPELFVISIVPGDQQTNVPVGSNVVVRFSTPPNPNTFGGNQIILVDQANSQQPISVTVDPVNAEYITITPVTPLAPGVTYGVAIRERVADANGREINPPFSARFSTGPTLATIPGFPPFQLPPGPPPPPGAPGTFTATGQLNNAMDAHQAVRLQDGTVLVCGGLRSGAIIRDAEIYNATTGTWRIVDDITPKNPNGKQGMNFRRFMHTATLLNNGTVLITGGTDGTVVHDTAEIYDPSTDSFAVLAGRMVSPRQRHGAVKLDNGNVLLVGGVAPGAIYDTMEVYDVTNGTFVNVNSRMNLWRDLPEVLRQPDGRILSIGGRTPAFLFGFAIITINSAETFRPTAGTNGTSGSVSPCGSRMSTTRWWHKATEIGAGPGAGLVIVTGGASNNPWSISLKNAEVYDYLDYGGAGGFRPIAEQMSSPRWDHEATFLSNDKVVSADGRGILVTGGFPTAAAGAGVASCDIFDPFGNGQNVSAPYRGVDLSGTFRPTQTQAGLQTSLPVPPLACGLAGHSQTLLLNDTVLIAGGADALFCAIPFTSSLALIYSP